MQKVLVVLAVSLPVLALTGANCDGSNIIPCTEDAECSGDTPVCDQDLGQCVADNKVCEEDSDCQIADANDPEECASNADCNDPELACYKDNFENTFCFVLVEDESECPENAPDFLELEDIEGNDVGTCVLGTEQCSEDGTACE